MDGVRYRAADALFIARCLLSFVSVFTVSAAILNQMRANYVSKLWLLRACVRVSARFRPFLFACVESFPLTHSNTFSPPLCLVKRGPVTHFLHQEERLPSCQRSAYTAVCCL